MNLSIRQLQAFREVMRTGSISEAARALNRTQPAVSAAIASLEEELGLTLFERQRGRLVRKPEAQFFLEETEAVLERLAHTSRTMKELASLKEGRLRIACMPASSQFMMPRLLADFVRDKPQVKVSLMMRASSVIEEWVASQQYDVGLAETPPPNSALATQDFALSCVCALRHDDPLAQKRRSRRRIFRVNHWRCYRRTTPTRSPRRRCSEKPKPALSRALSCGTSSPH